MANSKHAYYGDDRTNEEVDQKAHQSGGLYDSFLRGEVRMFKVHDGENCIRVLQPSWPKEDIPLWGRWWNIDIFMHYGVGPDNGSYLCLDKMFKEPCPVCEARKMSDDEDEIDRLAPKWRGLCWVVDRDNEKLGPQAWAMPVTMFREINERSKDKRSGASLKIDNPDNGYDIVFSKAGKEKKTKYTGVEIMRDPSPLHDDLDIQDKWLDFIFDNPLPSLLVPFEAEHIAKVLNGRSKKAGDDADGGGRASRSRGGDGDAAGDEGGSPRRRALAVEDQTPSRASRRPAADAEAETTTERPSRVRRPAAQDEEAGEPAPRERTRASRPGASDEQDPPFDKETGEVKETAPERSRSRREPATEEKGAPEKSEASSAAQSAMERMRQRRGAART